MYKNKFAFFLPVTFGVLEPKGLIAVKEYSLITTMILVMLLIVVPVLIMTIYTARKYRASNIKAEYKPDWDHNLKLESLWWVLSGIIILILAIMTWKSTHELDPYKPIVSEIKPVKIQVVALEWKWLFIYPEQNIATVNFIQIPAGTPINFELTADAPMNSFWIPQLGGQIYAMSGMSTKLHLIADEPGEFDGAAAEINGRGFSGMKFKVKATPQSEFDQWVQSIQQGQYVLSKDEYKKLIIPTEYNPVAYYASVEKDLYNSIIMKWNSYLEN